MKGWMHCGVWKKKTLASPILTDVKVCIFSSLSFFHEDMKADAIKSNQVSSDVTHGQVCNDGHEKIQVIL